MKSPGKDMRPGSLATDASSGVLDLLGGWPLPAFGGRLRIARNPNQVVSCSRGQKTVKNTAFDGVFGCTL
jgi:hypothetical protein